MLERWSFGSHPERCRCFPLLLLLPILYRAPLMEFMKVCVNERWCISPFLQPDTSPLKTNSWPKQTITAWKNEKPRRKRRTQGNLGPPRPWQPPLLVVVTTVGPWWPLPSHDPRFSNATFWGVFLARSFWLGSSFGLLASFLNPFVFNLY